MIKLEIKPPANFAKQTLKDYNFACAYALTKTAQDVQAKTRAELAAKFTLRNKFTASSVKIVPATKDNLESQVYSKAWYMPDQDTDGKRPAQERWIPGDDFERATGINPKQKVIPKKLRKGGIFSQKLKGAGSRPFTIDTQSGARLVVARQSEKQYPLFVLWVIVNRAISIRGRRFFQEPAKKEYDKMIEQRFNEGVKKYLSPL